MIDPTKLYRHSKTGKGPYKIHGIGTHTETKEEFVIYEALYDDPEVGKGKLWIRPLSMWEEEVLIDGVMKPRFVPIED